MESRYLEIEAEVRRRRRRLNALDGARRAVRLSMGATLAYLIAVYLGMLGPVHPPWAPVVVNLLALWGGARWGRRRPLELPRDLYRVDRACGLGEKLSTIYELRRTGGNARLLWALYRRLGDPHVDLRQALPLGRRERRGWLGVGSISLATMILLALWLSGVPPLGWDGLFYPGGRSEWAETAGIEAADRGLSPGERATREEPSDVGEGGRTACDPERQDCPPSSLLEEAGPRAGPQETSLSRDAAGLEKLRRALGELGERFARGELDPERLKGKLERLAGRASSGVRAALERAAEAGDAAELREQLDRALRELDRAGRAGRDSAEAGGPPGTASVGRAADAQETPSSPAEERAGSPGADGQGEAEGFPKWDGATDGRSAAASEAHSGEDRPGAAGRSGEGERARRPQEAAGSLEARTDPSAGASQGEAEGEAHGARNRGVGGERAGQQAGSGEDPAGALAGTLPLAEELQVESGLIPRDAKMLAGLLTRGVPVDLAGGRAGGVPHLRLNLARVESLLELRNLPPELRDVVRAYFLALAEGE